ncbi:MAG: protein arginine kinase [Thermoguttaceae bacterium]|nr:protein arginine kinase [Thermoguttaceae bacterium]
MDFNDLSRRRCAWLRDGGPDADVAISSRVRLARNLSEFSFVGRATENDLRGVVDACARAAEKAFSPDEAETLDMSKVSFDDARLLQERLLASREFVEAVDRPRALVLRNDETFSAMINEEDHLRLQAVASGFALNELWKKIDKIDDAFEAELDYAFDEKWGYLTACPSNVGAGIRASAMLHLPALLETNEIEKVLRGLQKMNLAVRGIFGEGSRIVGEFFQISNQATLGVSEEEVVEQLREVIASVINYERQARQTMLEKDRDGAMDRCCRAFALLKSARTISADEAFAHLSSVRLGVSLRLIESAPISIVNELTTAIRSSHLRRLTGTKPDAEIDEEALRAGYVREKLKDYD